jgi:hypothetical protein
MSLERQHWRHLVVSGGAQLVGRKPGINHALVSSFPRIRVGEKSGCTVYMECPQSEPAAIQSSCSISQLS